MLLCGLMYIAMITAFNIGMLRLVRNKTAMNVCAAKTFISVIIAARNEEANIGQCLEDLAMQQYPGTLFEIIVVDDDSTDETASIVSAFAKEHVGLSVKIIKPDAAIEGTRKKKAIGTAVNIAGGELIITTDADCRMGKAWLVTYAACYQEKHPAMIIGPVTYNTGNTLFAQWQTLEFLSLIASGAAMAGLGRPMLANAANMAFTKSAFTEAGGYAGNRKLVSGDDVFLLHAIKTKYGNRSVKFLWNHNALVYTYPQPTVTGFLNQHARWASKAKYYKDPWLIFVSLTVFLFSLVLIGGIAVSFIHWYFAWVTIILWLSKYIVDLPLLLSITDFTGQRRMMRHYAWFQMVYPFYVVIAAMAGWTGKFKWKGR
jgi:cellulose synthase/poly-beta-1,6-N-acetylglucosamine synthase-like glycosyltransferase